MGNRLNKITTRTGDDGTTGIAGTIRISKDDPRIEVMGSVDELNCHLGLLMTEALPGKVHELLAIAAPAQLRGHRDIHDLAWFIFSPACHSGSGKLPVKSQ